MNKLMTAVISLLLIISMTGAASALTVDITLAIPNQDTSAGEPIYVAPGVTTYFSIKMTGISNVSSLYNITDFDITAGPTPRPTLLLNYTPGGPIVPGTPYGYLLPTTNPYVAGNGFNMTVPSASNGTQWTFTVGARNGSDTASFTRSVIVYVQPANISGMKFSDQNNNSAKDGGEPGLSGWTINLKNATGGIVATTTTDGSGNYIFYNKPAGNYTVEEVLQANWTQTYPANRTYNVTLYGTDVTGLDFGNYNPPPIISGMKFNDQNNNGANDGEPGLSGWTIRLKYQSNGTVIATTTTNATGYYNFTIASAGSYTVDEVLQAEWIQTYPSTVTHNLTIALTDPDVTGLDFGNYNPPPMISGMKFNDQNNNGAKDAEPGLPGWTIRLKYQSNGTVIATTTTNATGYYNFTIQSGGSFTVEEVLVPDWTQTYPANGSYNLTVALTDPDVTGLDFGNYNPPPVASFTYIVGACDRTVTFNASSSTGNITQYNWDFNNDGVVDSIRFNNNSFTYTYPSGGWKTANLTVFAVGGQTNSTTRTFYVNTPPTASLTANVSVLPPGGGSVLFDASGSSDPDSDPLTYEWDLNNDGTFNTTAEEIAAYNQSSVVLNVTVSTTVTVRVSDPAGCISPSTAVVTVQVPTPPANQSLRIYGEDDYGPGTQYGETNPICSQAPNIYTVYNDSFNPGVIPKDSVTFNPAIILWDGTIWPMSANGANIDVKKFLRIWYEPNHTFDGCLDNPTYHPTLEIESTYMLIKASDKSPTTGSVAGNTTFAFPIAEIAGQIGLGSFNGSGLLAPPAKVDLVDLAYVGGSWANGTIRLQHEFTLGLNQQVQFLDHKLKLVSLQVDPYNNTRRFAKVEVVYAGNLADDTLRTADIGIGDPTAITYFDRHNNPYSSPVHPDTTWYAQLAGYQEAGAASTAQIVLGKEISAGDTFYVNSVRYDVPAVYVPEEGEFKYITLRTPLPKGGDVVREESSVSSQWISEIGEGILNPLPLDPPFNMVHAMVDDINIDLNITAPGLQPSPLVGGNDTLVANRILGDINPLTVYYRSERIEPRYSTDLLEILLEEETQTWKKYIVQTMPDQYTELVLPTVPDYQPEFLGDYLVTLSFYANNSNGQIDHIYDAATGMPRVVFVYDAETDSVHSKDLYINDILGSPTVRIYGEDDIGPGETQNPVQPLGPEIYTDYDDPFDPAEIPKDSITFNPAIILWDGQVWAMSADSQNADVKKFLRMWYEPNHVYNGILNNPTTNPTIEVETTYMLIDSKHKMPLSGSAGTTTFAFPTAELDGQIGIGSFDGNKDRSPDLVSLAYVAGDGTNGTIRIEKTYQLTVGDQVQFLDHKLTFQGIAYNPDDPGRYYAQADIDYSGNLNDDSTVLSVLLGNVSGNPTGYTFVDRHNVEFSSASHPDPSWYARLEFYSYGCAPGGSCTAQITVGKELSAGDTFYVNSVRYDVPAIFVPDGKFKYITLRTPLPKGDGDTVGEASVVSSQWITTIPPDENIPLNPPFNENHYIVDDIDVSLWTPTKNTNEWPLGNAMFPEGERYLTNQTPPQAWINYFEAVQRDTDNDGIDIGYDVNERIIGLYAPLEVQYVSETIEPRYRTNILEILRENRSVEDWYYYNITTLPINYTEFLLQPDFTRRNQVLHNDYLITLSWLAPDSEEFAPHAGWIHEIEDDSQSPFDERVAFVFDAIDSTGLYINELVEAPPAPPNQPPVANLTLDKTSVDALELVTADPAGTNDPNGDPITLSIDWGDGTVTDMGSSLAPVSHSYNRSGAYNVVLSVSDGTFTSNNSAMPTSVLVNNDGVVIHFNAGWNQISTPIVNINSAGALFATVPGYVQTWRWDRPTQDYATAGGAPLVPGEGYFVWASGAADVKILGTAATLTYANLDLTGEWNNVGPGITSIHTPGYAYHWNPTYYKYDIGTTLEPTKGYWIHG